MSKKRVIDTELYFDTEMCSILGDRGIHLYIRLWGLCDDSGVYPPNYGDIALQMGALRFTPEETKAFIESLIKAEKVIVYESHGKQYHWLKNFIKRQPLNNPALPRYPLPEWIKVEIKQYGKSVTGSNGKRYAKYTIIKEKVPVPYHDSSLPESGSSLPESGSSLPESGSSSVVVGQEIDFDLDLKRKDLTRLDLKDIGVVPYTEIVEYLNQRTQSKFSCTSRDTRKHIKARWNEKRTLEDFKRVIDNMTAKWLNDPKMSQYLRPQTLFGTKFESYLNVKVTLSDKGLVSPQTEKNIAVASAWKPKSGVSRAE